MIIPTVDLVISSRSRCVGYARPEPVRVLPHEIIIESVLEGSEDDDGSGELQVDFLDGFVGQDGHSSGQILSASGKK